MAKKNYGNYCTVNGIRIELEEHPTDFSIHATADSLDGSALDLSVEDISANYSRSTAKSRAGRNKVMEEVRKRNVAHHVYVEKDSKQEFTINDRIFVRTGTAETLQKIKEEHQLVEVGMMVSTHILKVTNATGRNPIKTANMIDELDDVEYCSPQLMVKPNRHQTPLSSASVLFREQWYLSADLIRHPDVDPRSDIEAPEAWQITMGDPGIVIGVMDDGVDLGHPAFAGKTFDRNGHDFADGDDDPNPGPGDFHGTPVASIAAGSQGSAMVGVAPRCTVLPLRIDFGPLDQQQTLREFQFASRHADVLNCSFGFPPLPFSIFDPGFTEEISELTRTTSAARVARRRWSVALLA
ncbi:MAG: S8 family serine peptidase [Planctomycetota bacterium]